MMADLAFATILSLEMVSDKVSMSVCQVGSGLAANHGLSTPVRILPMETETLILNSLKNSLLNT